MNIAYDAKRAFHNKRGLGNYSRDLLRIMATFYPDNNYYLTNPSPNKEHLFNHKGMNIISPQGLWKTIPSLWRSIGVCQSLKDLNIHLYHGLSQELPLGIDKIANKSVVTIHDALFLRYPHLYDPLYVKIFTSKNKYACKVANHIIAISEQTKKDIIHYFGVKEEKISVVYQGCNNIFRIPVSEEMQTHVTKKYHLPDSFILYVGAIEEKKNISIILEAMHIGRINLPLILIGNGNSSYKNKIKTNAEKKKISLLCLENVPTSELPAFYTLANLFVLPSFFEGFGIPILEAMCCSTPFVASSGTCFEEVGGDAGFYANPHDAENFAHAMNNILQHPSLAQSLGVTGKIRSELFSDSEVAHKLLTTYTHILEK